jgi:hypothetical protein
MAGNNSCNPFALSWLTSKQWIIISIAWKLIEYTYFKILSSQTSCSSWVNIEANLRQTVS